MKILVMFLFIINLYSFDLFESNNYYMVLGKPLITASTTQIVKDAIVLGYSAQIEDLRARIQESGKAIVPKYMGVRGLKAIDKRVKFFLEADKNANKELNEFMKLVHRKIFFKPIKLKLSLKKLSLNSKFSAVNLKISKVVKVNKFKFLEDNFETVINRLKRIYRINDFKMPFYLYNYKRIVSNYKLKEPNLFFYEYYLPQMRGRRYFLKIYIYMVSIDKDGKPSLEYRTVKDFNWERNYRFIAAQTGYVVRELIKNKLGVDIR